MRRLLSIPLVIALASRAWAADGATAANQFPEFSAKDARAPAVTEDDLLANERFWPYQVALTRDEPGAAPPPGSIGVLIRVEEGRKARIDFGRDGIREVPVADTDLVERANLVRRGELDKIAANFVLSIGPRLLDPSAPELRAYSLETAAAKRGFICVFADPGARNFPELAKQLAPLVERHGVATILFPQGRHSDAALQAKLESLQWAVPFVYDHLSEAYTRTLLPAGIRPPAVVLQTKEGRVLLQGAWNADLPLALSIAVDRAFADGPAASASAERE
jgi:hypothetical protein